MPTLSKKYRKSIMKDGALCMHSYSIKNKNMHFHIIIHSMEIMHSMYMSIRFQCTHASLPKCPYKKNQEYPKLKILYLYICLTPFQIYFETPS